VYSLHLDLLLDLTKPFESLTFVLELLDLSREFLEDLDDFFLLARDTLNHLQRLLLLLFVQLDTRHILQELVQVDIAHVRDLCDLTLPNDVVGVVAGDVETLQRIIDRLHACLLTVQEILVLVVFGPAAHQHNFI
jgi:hypothetical protein